MSQEFDARGRGMWGRSVVIDEYSNEKEICRGHGWWSPRPEVDDTILIPSQLGFMRLLLTEVEHTFDPDDMFFFHAVPIDPKDPDPDA